MLASVARVILPVAVATVFMTLGLFLFTVIGWLLFAAAIVTGATPFAITYVSLGLLVFS